MSEQAKDWLVYSREHNAWWAPDGPGYRIATEEAGRFTREEANDICDRASVLGLGVLPPEIMVYSPPLATIDSLRQRAERLEGALRLVIGTQFRADGRTPPQSVMQQVEAALKEPPCDSSEPSSAGSRVTTAAKVGGQTPSRHPSPSSPSTVQPSPSSIQSAEGLRGESAVAAATDPPASGPYRLCVSRAIDAVVIQKDGKPIAAFDPGELVEPVVRELNRLTRAVASERARAKGLLEALESVRSELASFSDAELLTLDYDKHPPATLTMELRRIDKALKACREAGGGA